MFHQYFNKECNSCGLLFISITIALVLVLDVVFLIIAVLSLFYYFTDYHHHLIWLIIGIFIAFAFLVTTLTMFIIIYKLFVRRQDSSVDLPMVDYSVYQGIE
jgi:hypothetical protein